MDAPDKNIGCSRFGGKRFAPACITQDRYMGCRRLCPTLAAFIEKNPDVVKQSLKTYKRMQSKGTVLLPMKYAGKRLPAAPGLKCTLCRFGSKTMRGLKLHIAKTHGGRTLK